MIIENLKTSNGNYISSQFLEQVDGIESFSNVESIKLIYASDGEPDIINNNSIIKSDNEGYSKLEEFTKNLKSKILIEKDIFNNEKIWIKEDKASYFLLNSLKDSKTINVSVLKDIINKSLSDYYKTNKLHLSILNGLGNEDKKVAYKDINPEEMKNKFIDIASKENIDFHIEGGKCFAIVNKDSLKKIKEKIKHSALQTIKIKSLLKDKSSSLNELIQGTKIAKIKNKP